MTTSLTDTQTIKLAELKKDLEQAQQEISNQPDLESTVKIAAHIAWLKKKINFLTSPWYQEYKATNARLEQMQ